jgi:hypothetical protein
MKKLIVIVSVVVLTLGLVTGAMAGNSLKQKDFGISVGFSDDGIVIGGRYFVIDTLAVMAELGFEKESGDRDDSHTVMAVGARKYLKKEDFSPFAGGQLMYERDKINGDTESIGLVGYVGAEYFLHTKFSIEGSVGIGVARVENNAVNPEEEYTVFGTTSGGVRANFYF